MDLYTLFVFAIFGVWALSVMLSWGSILMVDYIVDDKGAAASTDACKKARYLFNAALVTLIIATVVYGFVIYMTWLTTLTAIVGALALSLGVFGALASSAQSDLRRAEADLRVQVSTS
jgi:hypothetical protein